MVIKSQTRDCLCFMHLGDTGIDQEGIRDHFLGLTGKEPEGPA